MNVLQFTNKPAYRKRVNTAHENNVEVIVLLDHEHECRADVVALVKRCLGYSSEGVQL